MEFAQIFIFYNWNFFFKFLSRIGRYIQYWLSMMSQEKTPSKDSQGEFRGIWGVFPRHLSPGISLTIHSVHCFFLWRSTKFTLRFKIQYLSVQCFSNVFIYIHLRSFWMNPFFFKYLNKLPSFPFNVLNHRMANGWRRFSEKVMIRKLM